MKVFACLLGTLWLAAVSIAWPLDTLWTYQYGDRYIPFVAPTRDGGCVALVRITSSGSIIMRLDSARQTVWSHWFNGTTWEMKPTQDGGFLLLALRWGLVVLKYDSAGNNTFTREYSGGPNPAIELQHHIAETIDGGFVTVGYNPHPGRHIWRFNAAGDTLWHRVLPNDPSEIQSAIPFADNPNGNITLVSCLAYYSTPHGNYLKIEELSPEGDPISSRVVTDSTHSITWFDARRDAQRHIWLAGIDGPYHYAARFTPAGDTLWTEEHLQFPTQPAYQYCRAKVLDLTDDGGCITGGSVSADSTIDHDPLIVKLDAAGNRLWSLSWRMPNVEQVTDICQTSDGGYVAAVSRVDTGGCCSSTTLLKLGPTRWRSPEAAALRCYMLPGSDLLQLYWDEAPDAIHYHVYSSSTPGSIEILEAIVPAPLHSWEFVPSQNVRFFTVTAEFLDR